MKTRKPTRALTALLVAGALIPAAPAAANVYAPVSDGPEATQKDDSEGIVLRRDGDRSTPFVAQVSPEATPTATATDDGFDWGDAAIGAGASLLIVALVASGAGAVGGRRRQSPTPASAAS
jgi:hypothetical protein